MKKMKLYCCGSRGSWPVEGHAFNEFGGNTSCYVLKVSNYALVIDVGTGFYNAQSLLKDCEKIDVILTHLHYDHILGLLDWTDFPKDRLTFYGSFNEWIGSNSLSDFFRDPFWPVIPSFKTENIPEDGKTLKLSYDIEVNFYPSAHPNSSKELIIKCKEHKIVVMFDNELSDSLDHQLIKNADILIYDGMYTDEEYESKKGYGHSTYQEGARLANKVKPNKLIITHHNPSNEDSVLRDYEIEARTIYPHTDFARAGQTWTFPMPKPDERKNDLDYVELGMGNGLRKGLSALYQKIKKNGNREYYTILIANLFFSLFSAIFTLIDYAIIKNIPYQIFITIAVLFFVNYLILQNKRSLLNVIKIVFSIESCFIICALLVTANNIAYGFSWFLLMPVAGFFVFGRKTGLLLNVILYIVLCFLLKTEIGNAYIAAEIPADASTKLPMLFFNYCAISCFIETVRVRFSYELSKTMEEQETLIQRQTQELRDQNYSLLATNERLQMRNDLLSKTFGSFMPDESVLNHLKSKNDATFKPQREVVTILKCGIRDFTNILINSDTARIVEMINYHFDCLSKIIEKHNGIIVEYAGDSFVAVFGSLEKETDHQSDAVVSALEIQKEMANIKKHCQENNFVEYEIGVAVHTGEAVLSAFGSSHQLKYGVIGPNVSIVFIMEKQAKGNEVIISSDCLENMKSTVHITDMFKLQTNFKGAEIECCKIDGIGLPYCVSLKD